MKITKALLLGAVGAAALIATQSLQAADFSPSELSNRAVASSPRAREQFPWLTRQTAPGSDAAAQAAGVPLAVKNHRGLASSPRMREQYPELAWAVPTSTDGSARTGSGKGQLSEVLKNSALASSPRMREKFPELARQYGYGEIPTAFEVAPLK